MLVVMRAFLVLVVVLGGCGGGGGAPFNVSGFAGTYDGPPEIEIARLVTGGFVSATNGAGLVVDAEAGTFRPLVKMCYDDFCTKWMEPTTWYHLGDYVFEADTVLADGTQAHVTLRRR